MVGQDLPSSIDRSSIDHDCLARNEAGGQAGPTSGSALHD